METESWFKWDSEEERRMTHVSRKYTACEVLRQIYAMTDNPEIRMKLRIATTMCKSMATRITKYEGRGWGMKIYPRNLEYKP